MALLVQEGMRRHEANISISVRVSAGAGAGAGAVINLLLIMFGLSLSDTNNFFNRKYKIISRG
jgi:hypothetical protein